MKDQYETVMTEARSLAFIKIVHNHPDATLPELSAFADGCGLDSLTLGQCFLGKIPTTGKGWAKRLAPRRRRALPSRPGKPGPRTPTQKLNLRKQADRDVYDERMLAAAGAKKKGKRGYWWSAVELRAVTKGDPHQARASLNRLIESGQVEYQGRTMSVRYRAKL